MVLTIFGALHIVNPVAENPTDFADLIEVETEHAPALFSYNARQILSIMTGGDQAYDGPTGRPASRGRMLASDRPQQAARVHGRGLVRRLPARHAAQLLRPPEPPPRPLGGGADAPRPGAPAAATSCSRAPGTTSRAGTGVDIYRIEMAWFDRWLKGRKTGIEDTSRPLHVSSFEGSRWVDSKRYPFSETAPAPTTSAAVRATAARRRSTTARLTTSRPAAPTGADRVEFVNAQSPCGLSTDQWGARGAQPGHGGRRRCLRTRARRTTAPCRPVPARSPTRPSPSSATPCWPGRSPPRVYATSTRPEHPARRVPRGHRARAASRRRSRAARCSARSASSTAA